MDILNNLILWLHFMGLIGGGALAVTMPIIGMQLAGATPDGQQRLSKLGRRLSMISRGALVVSLVTGLLLFWLKWDFHPPNGAWFGTKMLLVVILIGLMVVSGMAYRRASAGDAAAMRRARMAGQASSVTLVLIVLAAVFAFN